MDGNEAKRSSPMLRLATHIVDKRNLVFLLVGIALIFSLAAKGWVSVENDLTAYLPSDSETKEGLDVMEKQFITYGSANIMAANVSYEEAEALFNEIKSIEGVQRVDFDDTTEHFNHASALYSVTFDYPENDPACLDALAAVKAALEPRDTYVSTSLGDTSAELIQKEVNMITAFVAVIVVLVLTFTSQTYAEVPIIGLTFVVAAVLNTGTNFLMGTISFVSNSVTTILQLALSLDYAVIYCNRFKEEKATHDLREAVILSLSKAIPEVGASSLTTIGGLGDAGTADAHGRAYGEDKAQELRAEGALCGPLRLRHPIPDPPCVPAADRRGGLPVRSLPLRLRLRHPGDAQKQRDADRRQNDRGDLLLPDGGGRGGARRRLRRGAGADP